MTCGRKARSTRIVAQLLKEEVSRIPKLKIVYPVEANGVFAQVPSKAIAKLQEQYFFYVWSEEESVVRWMCSFDTTEEDIRQFSKFVAETVK
jgi:threonine aldolase